LNTEQTLVLASSKVLQQVIYQLHSQGVFNHISEQVACSVDDLEILSDVSSLVLPAT